MNADAVIADVGGNLKGYNMFTYCFNNPVNMSDEDGNWPKWIEKVTSWVKEKIINPIKGFVSGILTVRHDVPLYDQGQTNLCWAYSQTMIEDFNSGTTRTQEEADDRAEELGRALHGDDNWNRGGRPQNAVSIGTPSIMGLYIRLNIHGPLYASYGLYDDSGTRRHGHAIVITGVDVVNGIVYTNNPGGVQGEQSYDDFLQIFAGGDNSSWHLDNCYYLS